LTRKRKSKGKYQKLKGKRSALFLFIKSGAAFPNLLLIFAF
jgi:hypothetical protein